MLPIERRAVAAIAAIYSVRMLGLFMLLPVLALYVVDLPGASPALVGIAIGAYGITQACLQIPFGLASDRFGRKRVIAAGLVIFALGGVIAAGAESIHGVIAGRAIQGAGAISAALTALLADLTRSPWRTRSMAFIGISIGASFMLALILGPALGARVGLAGLFWATVLLAALALAVLVLVTPGRWQAGPRTAKAANLGFVTVLQRRSLLGLDAGIFVLHFVLTASFVALPFVLRDSLGFEPAGHWRIYLGVMLASLVFLIPMIRMSERVRPSGAVTVGAVALLVGAELLIAVAHGRQLVVLGALVAFFGGFNFLEARLPARISQLTASGNRGAALGVYASAQFAGAFAGGVAGGALLGAAGLPGVFFLCGLVALIWLIGIVLAGARHGFAERG